MDKLSQSSSILTLSGDVLKSTQVEEKTDDSSEKSDKLTLQEPDVIASTKSNGKSPDNSQELPPPPQKPVAPPRRKKKSKPQTPSDLAVRFYNLSLFFVLFCFGFLFRVFWVFDNTNCFFMWLIILFFKKSHLRKLNGKLISKIKFKVIIIILLVFLMFTKIHVCLFIFFFS